MSEPSALEQYQLELINTERASAGVQPLAFDFILNDAAAAHSQWMIATDTFSHTGVNGSSPLDRMVAAGFQFTGSWANGENIAWASLRGAPGYDDEVLLLHQNLMNSPGHRENILNPTYKQIGLGFEVGEFQGYQGAFVSQEFAKTGSASYLTGVAFDDKDGDRAYDAGEGLAGLSVRAVAAGGATYTTTTFGSGGYNIALPAGSYTLTFSGGGFTPSSQSFTIGASNVKIDLVDPAIGGAGGGSAGTGTAGADVLHGTAGADTIFGGLSNDTIDAGSGGVSYLRGDEGDDSLTGGADFDDINGNMGNDTARGGEGSDWVVGGKDNDVLFGESGDDIVYGNIGNDTADGGIGDDIVRGGQDNDTITGGAGNDWLSGDRGSDTITGGSGADIFHTFGDAGVDRVMDFNRAEGDRVMVDPGTTYTVIQAGADTIINMAGGAQMVLVGVSPASLSGDWIFGA